MAWVGLERYGFIEEASRLAYRWIYMMTVAFVDCQSFFLLFLSRSHPNGRRSDHFLFFSCSQRSRA